MVVALRLSFDPALSRAGAHAIGHDLFATSSSWTGLAQDATIARLADSQKSAAAARQSEREEFRKGHQAGGLQRVPKAHQLFIG